MNREHPRVLNETPLTFPPHLLALAEERDLIARFVDYAEDDNHEGGTMLELYEWTPGKLTDPAWDAIVDSVDEARDVLAKLTAEDVKELL